jgi:hypothetical protein
MMVWEAEEKAKAEGIEKASAAKPSLLMLARAHAVDLAQRYGVVSIDDVRQAMGTGVSWGNWAGAIFRTNFRSVGTTRCVHKGGHRRMVQLWALKEN